MIGLGLGVNAGRVGLPHLEGDAVAAGVKELVQLGTGTLDGGFVARNSDDAYGGICRTTCEGCERGPRRNAGERHER
jgi:hypothetical protein